MPNTTNTTTPFTEIPGPVYYQLEQLEQAISGVTDRARLVTVFVNSVGGDLAKLFGLNASLVDRNVVNYEQFLGELNNSAYFSGLEKLFSSCHGLTEELRSYSLGFDMNNASTPLTPDDDFHVSGIFNSRFLILSMLFILVYGQTGMLLALNRLYDLRPGLTERQRLGHIFVHTLAWPLYLTYLILIVVYDATRNVYFRCFGCCGRVPQGPGTIAPNPVGMTCRPPKGPTSQFPSGTITKATPPSTSKISPTTPVGSVSQPNSSFQYSTTFTEFFCQLSR